MTVLVSDIDTVIIIITPLFNKSLTLYIFSFIYDMKIKTLVNINIISLCNETFTCKAGVS